MDGLEESNDTFKGTRKYIFENTFRINVEKPWTVPGLAKIRPKRVKPAGDVSVVTDVTFVAPLGFIRQKPDYVAVTSMFKIADAPELCDARVVEYYECTMQSVSFLIVMPRDQIKGLPSIQERFLDRKLSDVYGKLNEKKVTLVMPAKIHRILESAKIANCPKSMHRLQKHVQMEARMGDGHPKEPDFTLDGPFLVVLYDLINHRSLGLKWVYDVIRITKGLKDLLSKFSDCDGKLLKHAIRAKNSDAPLDVEPVGSDRRMSASKLLVPSAVIENRKQVKQSVATRGKVMEQAPKQNSQESPTVAPLKSEPPKVNPLNKELPKMVTSKTEIPKVELPKVEPPKVEPLKLESAKMVEPLVEPGKPVEKSTPETVAEKVVDKAAQRAPEAQKIQVFIPKISGARYNSEKLPVAELVKHFEPKMKKRTKMLEELQESVRPMF